MQDAVLIAVLISCKTDIVHMLYVLFCI